MAQEATHDETTRVAWAGVAVVLTVMAWPLFIGQVYSTDDLAAYHLPVREFYAAQLQRGEAFDWMPDLFCGFYLTGSGQAGTWHPWHWLLYRTLPLETAFTLEVLSPWPWMLAGMVLLLRPFFERPASAVAGAAAFAFSGFCLLHFLHPNAVSVVAHIPWLLGCHTVLMSAQPAAVPTLLRPPDRRLANALALAAIPMLTASQLLLGYPQYVWFSLLCEGLWLLAFSRRAARTLGLLAGVGGLKLLGLLLGSIQILPSIDALADSERGLYDARYFDIGALAPANLLQLLAPYASANRVFGDNTHELGLYAGAMPLMLAVVALSVRSASSAVRRLKVACLLTVCVALWLGFGRAAGLYRLQSLMPLIGSFRWPSRGIVLVHLGIAVLAAIGLDRLRTVTVRERRRLECTAAVIAAASIPAALAACVLLPPAERASILLILLGPGLFVPAWMMLRESLRSGRQTGLVLFLIGDLAAYGLTYAILGHADSIDSIREAVALPEIVQRSTDRVVNEPHIWSGAAPVYRGNQILLTGARLADGYEGLMPQQFLIGPDMTVDTLRAAGVGWVADLGDHSQIAGLEASSDYPGWLRVTDPWPRFRVVSGDVRVPIPAPEHDRVMLDADSGRHESVSKTAGRAGDGRRTDRGSLVVVSDRPGRMRLQTESPGGQRCVISERYHAGWRVEADGQPLAVQRVDLDLIGFEIPAGKHSIECYFAPESLRRGQLLSTAGLIVWTGFVLILVALVVRRPVADD